MQYGDTRPNLGRFIDRLTPEQKDRIIRAREWTPGGLMLFGLPYGESPACLVEHVTGQPATEIYGDDLKRFQALHGGLMPIDYGIRFDRLCKRFGTDKIVRLLKQRAGAELEDLESETPRETAEVA